MLGAKTIYRIPHSHTDREYREPVLLPIPEGRGEQWEQLSKSIKRKNHWILYPEGKD